MAKKMKTSAPKLQEPSFQAFQRAFTQHIRDPKSVARPAKVPAKRMAVYTEIVYNNIEGTFAACFPVTKSLLSTKKWQALVRSFMAGYRATTPIFREIPQQFLQHIQTAELSDLKLPAFLPSLMHYEWVELFVSTIDDGEAQNAISLGQVSFSGDLLKQQPIFSPTLQLLSYEYAVHKISAQYQPKNKMQTQLLVYRDASFSVKFIELNAITIELVALLKQEKMSGETALNKIANKINQIPTDEIIKYGLQILEDLKEQGVILGVYNNTRK